MLFHNYGNSCISDELHPIVCSTRIVRLRIWLRNSRILPGTGISVISMQVPHALISFFPYIGEKQNILLLDLTLVLSKLLLP